MATISSIKIEDVKTTADVNRIYFERCTSAGLETSLYTYILGIVGIPLVLKNFHKHIPIGIEYKLAIGAVSAMTLSYFAGCYAKKRCEQNLKKQLQAHLMSI